MTDLFFVDTNVLAYRHDGGTPAKRARADEWIAFLWRTGHGRLSSQVLIEYYNAITRRIAEPLDRGYAQREVSAYFAWGVVERESRVLAEAWRIETRYQLSWWDSLILATAQRAGCRYLPSEDFQAGQAFDGLTVVDPFATEPSAISQ